MVLFTMSYRIFQWFYTCFQVSFGFASCYSFTFLACSRALSACSTSVGVWPALPWITACSACFKAAAACSSANTPELANNNILIIKLYSFFIIYPRQYFIGLQTVWFRVDYNRHSAPHQANNTLNCAHQLLPLEAGIERELTLQQLQTWIIRPS